jgi:hypothetical protein
MSEVGWSNGFGRAFFKSDGFGVPKTNQDKALSRHMLWCDGNGCITKPCPAGQAWRSKQSGEKWRAIDGEPTPAPVPVTPVKIEEPTPTPSPVIEEQKQEPEIKPVRVEEMKRPLPESERFKAPKPVKRGRPRKYTDTAARSRAYRARKRERER